MCKPNKTRPTEDGAENTFTARSTHGNGLDMAKRSLPFAEGLPYV